MAEILPVDERTLENIQKKAASLNSEDLDPRSDGWYFYVPARSLYIYKGNDSSNWRWKQEAMLEVAELISIQYLFIEGSENLKNFEAEREYEVFFFMKMTKTAEIPTPVTLTLELPGQEKKERKKSLKKSDHNKWVQVLVGYFTTPKDQKGEVKFCLKNEDETNKSGLIIGGAVIQPCGWTAM